MELGLKRFIFCNIRYSTEIKKPRIKLMIQGFGIKTWQCPTFTWGDPTLSSALSSFTSEFEMGSGGTHSLWLPGKLVVRCIEIHLTNSGSVYLVLFTKSQE